MAVNGSPSKKRTVIRRGVALPAVLLVLVVVAGLMAAGLMMTVADHRTGLGMVSVVGIMGRAEREAVLATQNWTDRQLRSLADGAVLTLGGPGLERSVTRRGPGTFLFEGRITDALSGVERRVGIIGKAEPALTAANLAISSNGSVRAPTGVIVLDSPTSRALVCDVQDSTEAGWIAGVPGTTAAETVSSWRDLATITVLPGATIGPRALTINGACNDADPLNWGDPAGVVPECSRHYPVVYSSGSMTVSGGVGQGVLVVDGDLELTGGFRFDGLLVVGGRLITSGVGASIHGAVSIEDRGGLGTDLGNFTRIAYSACSLDEATRMLGPIRPLRRGGWFGEY